MASTSPITPFGVGEPQIQKSTVKHNRGKYIVPLDTESIYEPSIELTNMVWHSDCGPSCGGGISEFCTLFSTVDHVPWSSYKYCNPTEVPVQLGKG